MPPADDNTPDFDSMSPEELMAWMETLAERQGATEGFTTEERVEIDEVDPDTVEDTGPGYIPYGLTAEEWAEKQKIEEEDKQRRIAERKAQQAAQQPPAAPPEDIPAAPPPEPAAPAAAAPADGQPDLESMSPEELMAWMETLAERQGATEGFVTETRYDIAEVDPDTAQDTGPGYIPYGLTAEEWAEKQKIEEEDKQRRIAERKAQQAAQQTPPEPEADLPLWEDVSAQADDIPADEPMELPGFDMEPETTTEMAPAEEGLAWLESLAADQGADLPEMDLSGLGEDVVEPLDLDALAEPVTPAAEAPPPPGADDATPGGDDPMAWLEGLSQGEEEPAFALDAVTDDEEDEEDLFDAETELYTPGGGVDLEDDAPAAAASGDVDTMAWLESLAREQGADPDEFATGADIPLDAEPDMAPDADAPGYTAYTFEDDDVQPVADVDDLDAVPSDPDDPVAWLDALAAGGAGAGDDEDDDLLEDLPELDDAQGDAEPAEAAVLDALNNADDVSADAVKGWMDSLLEQGANRTDAPPDYVEEEDEAVAAEDGELEANIPDWLTEQVGPPPEDLDEPVPEAGQPALLDELVEPDEVEIPAWLQEDIEEGGDLELDDIFADGDEAGDVLPEAPERDPRLSTGMLAQIEEGDSWVEAFEMERKQGQQDVDNMPEWYRERLRELGQEPGEVAAALDIPLAEAALAPETTLPPGDPQPVPDWAASVVRVNAPASQIQEVTYQAGAVEAEDADDEIPAWLRQQVEDDEVEDGAVPEWLRDAGLEDAEDVPEWLRETVHEEGNVDTVPVLDFGPDTGPSTEPEVDEEDLPEPPPSPLATMPPQALRPVSAQRPGASPAPVEPVAPDFVAEVLAQARQKTQSGDIAAAMQDYEQVVRANMELEAVEAELTALVKGAHKKNATVLRVLGDTLMRRGELQQALDTYRKALNLL